MLNPVSMTAEQDMSGFAPYCFPSLSLSLFLFVYLFIFWPSLSRSDGCICDKTEEYQVSFAFTDSPHSCLPEPWPLWQEGISGVCGDGGVLPSFSVAVWHLLRHSCFSCSVRSASPGQKARCAQTAHSYFITGPPPAKRNSVQSDGNEREAEVGREIERRKK